MTEAINLMGSTAAPAGGGRFGAYATVLAGREPALQATGANGQSAPPAVNGVAAPTAQEVAVAAQELQEYAQQSGAELSFRVEEDLGRVVVSVIDSEDGTVLRQIPGEETLRIARAIEKFQDGNLMQEVA